MAEGLRLLVEGMIEAMLSRHDQGTPMEEVLRTELIDLTAMNATIEEVDRQPSDLLNALIAINIFAQTIFTRSKAENLDSLRFAEECRASVETFVRLVKLTEERHLDELDKLHATHGDIPAIRAVGKWLLQHADETADKMRESAGYT
jgi:hypothetical protein